MEVGAGVRRFGTRFVNCYLIEEGGRLTLLDAGLPGYWKYLLRELEAMGRRLEDIAAVLVTHSHPDHFGFAERVRSAAGAKVYSHPREIPTLTGKVVGKPPPFFSQGFRPFLYRFVIHNLRNGVTKRVPIAAVNEFADGEGSRRAWQTARCARSRPHGRLLRASPQGPRRSLQRRYAGHLRSADGEARSDIPADFINENSVLALESLARLENLDAATVLPGHGEPWTGGVKQAVELARAAAREWVKPRG